jgi:hypothetical protein
VAGIATRGASGVYIFAQHCEVEVSSTIIA